MTDTRLTQHSLPVSVIIVTRGNLPAFTSCIKRLSDFDDIHVVHTRDKNNDGEFLHKLSLDSDTYHYHAYQWNGAYPKKRQWSLENLPLKHEWVFMLDADEEVTDDFLNELYSINNSVLSEPSSYAGCFVRGAYTLKGQILRHGFQNNKLALFRRSCMTYPIIDDLECNAMGEIEGHYQPVFKNQDDLSLCLYQMRKPILHHAFSCRKDNLARHKKYAKWEAFMIRNKLYPTDPVLHRRLMKSVFQLLPCRAEIMFVYSYFLRLGFMDGRYGLGLAKSRYDYYKMVSKELSDLSKNT